MFTIDTFHKCFQNRVHFFCIKKCDVINQNQSELRNIDFKIGPNKVENVFLFPVGFLIFQLLISVEPIDQFQWGFLQNVAVKVAHTDS